MPIGFSPPEKITPSESSVSATEKMTPSESSVPVAEEKHDLKLEPKEFENPPVQPIFEKPVFTDLEKPKPKQTFGELKSESLDDYADLVDGIKAEVQKVKDKAAALAELTVEKTGLAPVYRGSKSALEKMTKTALMVRSVSQYGWWRLGKEATVDAVKRKGEELARKGLKYVLDNLSKRQDILNVVSKQLEKQAEPLKVQLAEIIAIKRQLEIQTKN